MVAPSWSPAKALAVSLGLAIALAPAGTGIAAAKTSPAKHRTAKKCVLKKKAKCKKAKITKAKVGKVNLAGANLQGASITGATFTGTDLTGVDLRGATISNTTFTKVKVADLNLDKAKLTNVVFRGVTLGGARQSARAQDCSARNDVVLDTAADVFTCSGGGVSMRGAVLSRHVQFTNSVIPFSDFSKVSTGEKAKADTTFGVALLVLVGTDAHASNFASARALVGAYEDRATGTRSNVSQSVFNDAWLWGLSGTNADQASFMGTYWAFGSSAVLGANDVTVAGARGLQGARGVTVNVAPGLSTVGAVNIHEDGYWKVGVLCNAAGFVSCTDSSVAVGQPVVVKAWATTPIQIAGPADWSCERLPGTGDYPYLAQCAVPATATGAQTATVEPYIAPLPQRQVSVQSVLSGNSGPRPADIWIDALDAAGGVTATTTCASAASCAVAVASGTRVQVRMQQSWEASGTSGWFDIWCPGEAPGDMATAHMSNQVSVGANPWEVTTGYTCPAFTVDADASATAWAS